MNIDSALNRNEFFAVTVLPEEFNPHRTPITFNLTHGRFIHESLSIELELAPFAAYNANTAQAETSRKEHAQAIHAALNAIENGKLEKVVISCIKHASRSNQSLDTIFQKLKDHYPDAFVYALHHPEYGTWMGATPELLVHKHATRFRTVSLAGTQLYSETQEIIWNDKLRREQSLVTDFILETIKQCDCSNITMNGPYTAHAGPLIHLKTDIHFSGIEQSSKIIAQLQPTPAVCGLPRSAAFNFILNNTSLQRRLYAGRIGLRYRNEDEIHFVNLRCMQVFDDHFELHVGGGIVTGSNADDEWMETEMKADVLRNLIN